MTDHDQQHEAGAECIGFESPEARMEAVLDKSMSPKAHQFGDGGDVSSAAESTLTDSLIQKTEPDDGVSLMTNSRRFNKSASPSSKRSSKRKRKNRRRREKKAAVATGTEAVIPDEANLSHKGIDDDTSTGTEFSQNSENVNKEDDTGTDSEGALRQGEEEEELSSSCVEPRIKNSADNILSADLKESMEEVTKRALEHCICAAEEEDGMASSNATSGSNQSVETILYNAKCKILSEMIEPRQIFVECSGKSDLHNDNNSKLVVPPCSPSSLHSINNQGNSTETLVSGAIFHTAEKAQKLTAKNVHFHEGPTKIVSMDVSPSEERVFELNLHSTSAASECEQIEAEIDLKRNLSKETVVLIENVTHIDSATSSIASETSAASLLKGDGTSTEDFTESSQHYPSRETVEESHEAHHDNNNSELKIDNFKETIHIFKIQNPLETQCIRNELDTILTNSLNKFTREVSMDVSPSEERVFELNLHSTSAASECEQIEAEIDLKRNLSKETVVLIENVTHIDSATSSIASETSAASLLKGDGSSTEDFTESSQHYPNRETVEESHEAHLDHNDPELKIDNFKETIHIFKIQNPLETQYIRNELDTISTNSLNKFTRAAAEQLPDDNNLNVLEDAKDNQGCNCARMCVIS